MQPNSIIQLSKFSTEVHAGSSPLRSILRKANRMRLLSHVANLLDNSLDSRSKRLLVGRHTLASYNKLRHRILPGGIELSCDSIPNTTHTPTHTHTRKKGERKEKSSCLQKPTGRSSLSRAQCFLMGCN